MVLGLGKCSGAVVASSKVITVVEAQKGGRNDINCFVVREDFAHPSQPFLLFLLLLLLFASVPVASMLPFSSAMNPTSGVGTASPSRSSLPAFF